MVQRYLRAKPDAAAAGSVRAPAPVPASTEPGIASWREVAQVTLTRDFDAISPGEQLPELVVDLSPTMIIAGALASQDFQDVHHDFLMSAQRGHPTIFMNMMTLSGLVSRFVTDWSGPDCIVRAHTLRLGRPNYAGDKLRLSATVAATAVEQGRRQVKLEFVGRNSLGNAIDGDLLVEFPR
jgi:acyl dehydratase